LNDERIERVSSVGTQLPGKASGQIVICFSIVSFHLFRLSPMKGALIFVGIGLLVGATSTFYAQQSSPATSPVGPQAPPPAIPGRPSPPAQAVVPVPVPIAP